MNKKYRNLVDVCLENLHIPIQIGKKSKVEGDSTITSISIKAKIANIFEDQFEQNVLDIINRTDRYIGPMQLSDNLISYLTSINARALHVEFNYPVFIQKKSSESNQKYLMKYNCKLEVVKTLLFYYTRKHTVEIPVIIREFMIPGIQKDILEIPVVITVEVQGFDIYFIEDIIELVEKQIKGDYSDSFSLQSENSKLLLLERVENELSKEFDVDKCSAKIITRKQSYSYSTKLSDENYKLSNFNEYETEHIFI